jgi:hypothetical protein
MFESCMAAGVKRFRSSAVTDVLVAAIVLFSWLLSLQFFMQHLHVNEGHR